ncbi:PREDICTED: nucleolar pre-ribosomal-associated protein 1 [Haliaeetus leucocephalus]|uniref:nucleolar pre-ribosomal-associated protein 1 n=1 Tax=Haliaeetus leucocephalus TaxID=52644 RepID=UPI00053CDE1D|nr:PREDICTED: nucleolar pre-ribosomal-associated protein 1 [Haliaeetus leucocephalus]
MELAKKQTWGRKTVIGIIEKEKDIGFNVHYGKNVEVIWLEVKLTVFLTILIKAYDSYLGSKETKNSRIAGLETFVSIAEALPSPGVYDVVEGYVKISMECAEIFKLLDGERKPESEMLLIFQALEAILLRTASDLSHFSVVGMNIVKKLIHSYMRLVYAALYSENHRMSRVCLTLLSAMVAQGPDSARDVYSHFDFNNKFLPGLLKKRCKKGRPDVRMAYIQFALSFLIAGDNAILTRVLELKDFIPDILRSEIKEDKVSTVNLLLSTLRTKVVQNKNITKTQKVRFFTAEVLIHIASLYRWNGITDVSPGDLKVIQGSEEVGKMMVRELVHNFLMDLCCSLKHGITFYDPSLGTSGKGGNVVLLRFLLGLKTATEDEMVADLMVNILKVCPDLLNRYFKETRYSFVPRLKSAWMDNMKLLKKIYEAQPEISNSFKTSEFIPLPRLLSMVMVTTVPAVCNKIMFTQGLNLPSTVVKHSILSLLSMVLRRTLKNIEYCLNEETWQKSEIYTPSVMQEFVQLYREAISKLLPDMNNIVAVWQSLLKQGREHHDGQEEKRESAISTVKAVTETPEVAEQHGSDDAETLFLKAALLQVICLYQKVVPHLVARSNFDFSKLLKGIVTEKGLREEVPPVLQHHILKVALELPANKFAWFRVQDVSETEKVSGEKSVFYLLLKMFVTSNHSHLKISTKKLIIKVLRDSGVFEYTWKELSVWLEHLDNTKEDKKEAVIQFLERILLKLVTNPYPYTDKAADLVQEASVLQVNMFKQDSDNISIPISHIDDVLDMMDVLIEGSDGLDEEIGFTLNEDMIIQTFPFSAIVPAALEARNILLLQTEDGTGAHIVEYLVAVFTDLLHSQREPLALCLMYQLYDKDLQSLKVSKYPQLYQFNQYYKLWIPQQSQEPVFKKCKEVCKEPAMALESVFTILLRKAYERGSSTLLEDDIQTKLRDLASQLPPEQLLLGVKHVLLYLKSTVESFGSLSKTFGPHLVDLYVDLLNSLLCRGNQVELDNQQKREDHQTESDLFMDEQSLITEESSNDKTLEDTLLLIFRHPTLESWFLALEQRSLPQHSLNPITVKLLSACLNSGVLQLLKTGAPMLQSMDHKHVLSKYFEAITKSVLKELEAVGKDRSQVSPKKSHQLEALEELHIYMTAAQLKEITLTMLRLPEMSLTTQKSEKCPRKGKQLSFYGQTLVQLLTESYQRQPQQGELLLSTEHIKALGILMSASASKDLEKVFLQALQSEPVLAHAVSVEVHVRCLNQRSETSLAIVGMLIKHCRTHLLQFELWCLSSATGKYLRKNMESFLPLINVYLQCRDQYDFTRPSTVVSAVTPVLRKALWKELCGVFQDTEALHETTVKLQVLSKLLPSSESKGLRNLIDQLPAALEKAENNESWTVADAISRMLENSEELHSWRRRLLSACLKGLVVMYNSSKDESKPEVERSMLLRLEELLCFVEEVDPDDWYSLVKTGLKYRYRDEAFLKVLNIAIQLLYKKESSLSQSLVKLSKLHMMVTQHSLFLSAILRSREEDCTNIQTREALVDILLTVVKLSPSLCESSHLAVLLGAYGATLSTVDQKILLLLQLYEKNNQSLINSRILLWGPAAVEHHKTCKSLGKSLWQQPSMEEILCLLDREKMMKTILSFPQHRRLLSSQELQESLYRDESVKSLDDFYDPRFLLQLFSELTRPECVVACHKFVEVNALGLTVAALSSYDSNMRAAAYFVLASFRSHLEGARFREKSQLLYLLDAVQNGIRQPNLRFTFSLTLYIARVAQQILKPEEHMYIKVNRFLLSHQYLDLRKVPGFFQLFYSFDFEYKTEREWILRFLGEGLRDKHCYELYDYQRIFQVILSFFNSPLCDEGSQSHILEILQNAAHVTRAAYELIQDHSLLTWILHILEKRFLENKLLNKIISLLHTLWLTNLGDKREVKNQSQENRKFLPIQFVNEFLYVLITLIKHIRTNLDLAKLTQFFSTLNSVLEYRAIVVKAFKEMSRFTVNDSVLSNKEILLLLHKWSIIEKDLQLQEDVQTLAQKYQIKELLKNIKEKNKSQASSHAYHHIRKKNEIEREDDSTADLEVSELEKCRDHLNSVFAHWEPVFPMLPAKHRGEPLKSADLVDETVSLTCASTYVVTKWLMKSMAEHSLNMQNVSLTLRWLQNCILPHPVAVQEILRDETLRNNIFKFYTQICEASRGTAGLFKELSLFSSIMLRLMDAQGLTNNGFHELMKNLCLSAMTEEDANKKAVCVFLTSVYIGDIWLGAQEPDMLITHVKLICSSTDDKLNDDDLETHKQGEETITPLCKTLYLATLGH